MLSTQFLEILNICKEYNIPISYLQASQLCNIEGSVFKRILEDFSNCPLDRKETFVEVLLDRGFMNIYGYEDILSSIANITEEEYEDLFKIITKPNVSKIPKIAQYVKVLYLLANQPMKLHSKEVVTEIAKIVPHTDFGDDADIIKSFLLDSFNSDYEIYVECDDEICFEDEHDGFAEDL